MTGQGNARLPRGTVTLLLADVEDSTRLWERSSTEARAAMEDLDALVDELVTKFDGARPLEQGEGDSFVAGFARPSDAVSCALELQRRLAETSLLVRLALHTGEIEVRDDARYEWESLTPMERQVVDLVADGLSNKQVAERLFVSARTVSTHLSHVFAKLGVSSRSELTAAAAKRGVLSE